MSPELEKTLNALKALNEQVHAMEMARTCADVRFTLGQLQTKLANLAGAQATLETMSVNSCLAFDSNKNAVAASSPQ